MTGLTLHSHVSETLPARGPQSSETLRAGPSSARLFPRGALGVARLFARGPRQRDSSRAGPSEQRDSSRGALVSETLLPARGPRSSETLRAGPSSARLFPRGALRAACGTNRGNVKKAVFSPSEGISVLTLRLLSRHGSAPKGEGGLREPAPVRGHPLRDPHGPGATLGVLRGEMCTVVITQAPRGCTIDSRKPGTSVPRDFHSHGLETLYHPGGNPGANRWFLRSTPIQTPPE